MRVPAQLVSLLPWGRVHHIRTLRLMRVLSLCLWRMLAVIARQVLMAWPRATPQHAASETQFKILARSLL